MTTQMPGEILAQNQCKCSHTSTLSFSFMLYNPAGPGGGGGAGGAGGGWEPRSRLERKAVPGKECSSRGGPGGERKGKVSLPGAKPATIFKPARPRFPTAHTRTHTHTHTHTRCKLLAGIIWSSLVQKGVTEMVPRKEGLPAPLLHQGQAVRPLARGGGAAKTLREKIRDNKIKLAWPGV